GLAYQSLPLFCPARLALAERRCIGATANRPASGRFFLWCRVLRSRSHRRAFRRADFAFCCRPPLTSPLLPPEISQIPRRLVLAGGHEFAVGAEEIVFLFDLD